MFCLAITNHNILILDTVEQLYNMLMMYLGLLRTCMQDVMYHQT